MISWQRLVYFFGLATMEATPPVILLSLAGALADWIILRRLPPPRQGLALATIGLLCALLVVKQQVLPGAGLAGGWGVVLGTIFSIRDERTGLAYLSLLATLYCFWRGTRMTLHHTSSLRRLFRSVTVVLLLIVG